MFASLKSRSFSTRKDGRPAGPGKSPSASCLLPFLTVNPSPAKDLRLEIRELQSIIQELSKPFFNPGQPPQSALPPHVYIGNYENAVDLTTLRESSFTHVLNVAGDDCDTGPYFYANEFKYKEICAEDSMQYDIRADFAKCFAFIDLAKTCQGKVLVHCLAGKSRSVTIVLAYIMKDQHVSAAQALRIFLKNRPCAAPNPNFLRQLLLYQEEIQVE